MASYNSQFKTKQWLGDKTQFNPMQMEKSVSMNASTKPLAGGNKLGLKVPQLNLSNLKHVKEYANQASTTLYD